MHTSYSKYRYCSLSQKPEHPCIGSSTFENCSVQLKKNWDSCKHPLNNYNFSFITHRCWGRKKNNYNSINLFATKIYWKLYLNLFSNQFKMFTVFRVKSSLILLFGIKSLNFRVKSVGIPSCSVLHFEIFLLWVIERLYEASHIYHYESVLMCGNSWTWLCLGKTS